MKALFLLGTAMLALTRPAAAQDHSGHDMRSMQMPAAPAPQTRPAPDPHAGHDMATMGETPAQDPHAGHGMSGLAQPRQPGEASGTDLPAGDAPAPLPIEGRAADRYWDAQAMVVAERELRREHGGGSFRKVMLDLAELRIQSGREGYRWDGEAWFGGDVDRFWLKSEGTGLFRQGVDEAEVQALYSRAIDPWWNVQAGIRQDLGPGPRRSWATLGVEGLAPLWFEIEGAVFLSDKGDLRARAQASYDQRLTQDLVLQPRVELNLAAQDMPANHVGSGLSDAGIGLRLRYERVREFAPYIGVAWERRFGRTADFARARGEDTGRLRFVLGVRTWF